MKISIQTLGCKVNQYESGGLFNLLTADFEITEKLEPADIYIINTCAVTNEAERKSRQMVSKCLSKNPLAKVVILGCASQNDGSKFSSPNVIGVLGVGEKEKVTTLLNDYLEKMKIQILPKNATPSEIAFPPSQGLKLSNDQQHFVSSPPQGSFRSEFNLFSDFPPSSENSEEKVQKSALTSKKNLQPGTEKLTNFPLPEGYEDVFTASHHKTRAFVKVQDGCNNFCSYCLIPYLRGRSRSRSLSSIDNELKTLENVEEVVFTGIDISSFEEGLISLGILAKNHSLRFRYGSLETSVIRDELLLGLKNLKGFCPHFHLSLQSGSESVLKRMNRKYSKQEYFEKTEKIREIFPSATITTDIIVGFPGESDEEFLETVEFVKKVKFFDVHIFPYSKRNGTKAAREADLPKSVKTARVKQLEKVASSLHAEFLKKSIDEMESCLFEEVEEGYFIGHSENFIKCYLKQGEEDDVLGKVLKVKGVKVFSNGLEVVKVDPSN